MPLPTPQSSSKMDIIDADGSIEVEPMGRSPSSPVTPGRKRVPDIARGMRVLRYLLTQSVAGGEDETTRSHEEEKGEGDIEVEPMGRSAPLPVASDRKRARDIEKGMRALRYPPLHSLAGVEHESTSLSEGEEEETQEWGGGEEEEDEEDTEDEEEDEEDTEEDEEDEEDTEEEEEEEEKEEEEEEPPALLPHSDDEASVCGNRSRSNRNRGRGRNRHLGSAGCGCALATAIHRDVDHGIGRYAQGEGGVKGEVVNAAVDRVFSLFANGYEGQQQILLAVAEKVRGWSYMW